MDPRPETPATGDGAPDRPRAFTPLPEQDENGVDLTLIRANLRLSPTERVRRADAARRSALRVQQIGREARAARRRSDATG